MTAADKIRAAIAIAKDSASKCSPRQFTDYYAGAKDALEQCLKLVEAQEREAALPKVIQLVDVPEGRSYPGGTMYLLSNGEVWGKSRGEWYRDALPPPCCPPAVTPPAARGAS